MIKRHTKPRPAPRSSGTQSIIPGGVIEREAPLNASNVAARLPGLRSAHPRWLSSNDKDGSKVRMCRKCKKDIDR